MNRGKYFERECTCLGEQKCTSRCGHLYYVIDDILSTYFDNQEEARLGELILNEKQSISKYQSFIEDIEEQIKREPTILDLFNNALKHEWTSEEWVELLKEFHRKSHQ